MVDFLALPTYEEGERAADARVDLQVKDFLIAQLRAEHELGDQLGVEPGVEDALWRRRISAVNLDPHRRGGRHLFFLLEAAVRSCSRRASSRASRRAVQASR